MSSIPDEVAAQAGSAGPANAPGEGHIAADPAAEETDNQSQADTERQENNSEPWKRVKLSFHSIFSSSTASLTESITEYRRLHGRTYTQKVDYWGPNDDRQNEGLDINHYWTTLLLDDKLFLAPIGDSPQDVLDVGTGTGIWAIDFADEFPSAEVVGVDISPIQPSWVPPNCKFIIDDIEQPWTFPANLFNLVHIRNLEGSVSDWVALYKKAFAAIKPGGYIEVKESDIEARSQLQDLPEGHVFKGWRKFLSQASGKLGKVPNQVHPDENGISNALQEAGFVDVVAKKWTVPVGAWASDPLLKEVGTSCLHFLDQSLEGFGTFLLKEVLGWEYAEAIVFISEMRKALKDEKMQPVVDFHVVHARKPEVESSPAPAA